MVRTFRFSRISAGAYIWIGQGTDTSCPLHHPGYDFDDRLIPNGAGLLAAIAERNSPNRPQGRLMVAIQIMLCVFGVIIAVAVISALFVQRWSAG